MFTVIIKVIKARKTSRVGLWEIHNLVKEWLNWSFKKGLWFAIERDVADFSTVRRFQKNPENNWSSMKHALLLSIWHLLAWDRNSTRHETASPSYNAVYEFIDLNGNLEDMPQFYDKCFVSISDCKEQEGRGDLGRWEPWNRKERNFFFWRNDSYSLDYAHWLPITLIYRNVYVCLDMPVMPNLLKETLKSSFHERLKNNNHDYKIIHCARQQDSVHGQDETVNWFLCA